jgi:hypothetical protein
MASKSTPAELPCFGGRLSGVNWKVFLPPPGTEDPPAGRIELSDGVSEETLELAPGVWGFTTHERDEGETLFEILSGPTRALLAQFFVPRSLGKELFEFLLPHAKFAEQSKPTPSYATILDIGVFGSHAGAIGTDVLLGNAELTSEKARRVVNVLRAGRASLKGGGASAMIVRSPARVFLDQRACRSLIDAVDEKRIPGTFDTKLELTVTQLEEIIGAPKAAALCQEFGSRVDEVRLRRVEAQPGFSSHVINFHLDTSLSTLHVPLVDGKEFEGNTLIYATHDGFQIPKRRVGCALIHDNTIPHGVTPLTRGVRYGLFLLSRPCAT